MLRAGKLLILICMISSYGKASSTIAGLKHGYINNQGTKLHYVTRGEGPLIVLLHGFPDFWYTWRNQINALSDNYQLVAIDLRGYNKSDKPKGINNYTMQKLISDVVAVIKYFPQDNAIVIGHDWGGAIAWQVAMWRPELVNKLIILSTPHPNGLIREINENKEQNEQSQYAFDFQKDDAYKSLTAEKLAEWVQDPEAKKLYIEAFQRSDFEAMLNYYKASFPKKSTPARSQSNIDNGSQNKKRVKCPTLAIFGLQDKALLASGWNDTWNWIDSDFTLVSIPDAGHFVHHKKPDPVTDKIISWLQIEPKPATLLSKNIKPFDQLIGTWNARQSIRNRDGTWTDKPQKYKWTFYTILEGEAVQDDWIVVDSTGSEQKTGTNIRIFNENEKQWHMAWIDKTIRRTAIFKATIENDMVMMDGTNTQGRHIRNTFYNISNRTFDWKQEWTFDEGKNWVEVARIRCEK